eukprot:3515385-Pyramimonas_sp.AAC.1
MGGRWSEGPLSSGGESARRRPTRRAAAARRFPSSHHEELSVTGSDGLPSRGWPHGWASASASASQPLRGPHVPRAP